MEGGEVSCTVFSKNGEVPVKIKAVVKEDNGYRYIFETAKIRLGNSIEHKK